MAERKYVAPYVAASTMSAFFDHIRYVREPEQVDADLLRDYGVKEGQVFALISALKFLGLTDEAGNPTPVFRDLQTGGDEFRDTLRGVVERAYQDLFNRLDVSRDSKDKIVNFFARNYSPATAEKAARLFLDLCGEAGITTAAQPRTRRPSGPMAIEAKRPRSPTPTQKANRQSQEHQVHQADFGNTEPRIDIRINSQDLVNMQADQIDAIFNGLARLTAIIDGERQKKDAGLQTKPAITVTEGAQETQPTGE